MQKELFLTKLYTRSQKEKFNIKYRLERKEGLEHSKFFLVSVFINGEKLAEAKASSIKEAEQRASKKIINSVF